MGRTRPEGFLTRGAARRLPSSSRTPVTQWAAPGRSSSFLLVALYAPFLIQSCSEAAPGPTGKAADGGRDGKYKRFPAGRSRGR